MNESDDIPEVDADRHTLGSLMIQVLHGDIRLPVWVRIGRARHKITPETKDGVCRGLLIAMDF